VAEPQRWLRQREGAVVLPARLWLSRLCRIQVRARNETAIDGIGSAEVDQLLS
jgi:hypothetical protein